MQGSLQKFNDSITPSYTEYKLTEANSTKDLHSLATSYGYTSGYNTVTIDRNKGVAYPNPDDCACWFWDTDLTAADGLVLAFDLTIANRATIDTSSTFLAFGLTSDTTSLNSRSYSMGIDFQTTNPRIIRKTNTTTSVSAQIVTMYGSHNIIGSGNGSNVLGGNIGWIGSAQAINSSNDSINSGHNPSISYIDANAGTDPLKLFLCIGTSASVASSIEMRFNLYVQNLITDTFL